MFVRFAIWGVALNKQAMDFGSTQSHCQWRCVLAISTGDPSRVIRARVRRFNGTVRSSVRCFDYSTAPNRFHQVSVTCLAVVFPSGKELEKQLGERAKCDF